MSQNFSEDDIKKVAKGAGTALFGNAIGRGLFFLSQLLIARFLGIEAFGLYAIGFAIVKVCEIFARLGLNTGGMRFVSIYYQEKNFSKLKGILISASIIPLLNGVIIGFIIHLSSGVIAQKIFHKPELAYPLQIFAFSIPFISGMTVVSLLLQGFHTTKYTVYTRDIVLQGTNILLIISFYLTGFGLSGVIYAFILSHFCALIASLFYCGKLFPEFKDRSIKPSYEIKNLISYSIPLLFVGFLYYLLSWTNILMLGLLSSTADVGIYRAASRVPFIMLLFLAATNAIYAPLAADLHQRGEMHRLSAIFKTTTRWITFATVHIVIFILFSSKEIMMLFGKEYIEIGYVVLIIVSFGQLINCITGGVGLTLTMTGKQRIELLNSVSLVIVNILLNYLLIPMYGSIGAAIATSISIAAINIARLLEVNKLFGLNPFDNRIFKLLYPASLSIIFLFILQLINIQYWYINLSLNLIAIVSIAGLFFVFGAESEDKYIFERVKNKLHFV